jgi:general secretion pathway protein J
MSRGHRSVALRPHGARRTQGGNGGFTLLELLIVIVIFAIMAIMAYGGLSQVLKVRAGVDQVEARTQGYQMLYLRLRNDFQNIVFRAARDNDGIMQPAFMYDDYSRRLEFTRAGWPNPLNLPRTGFERVSYRLQDDKLIRDSWRVLDRAPQSQPVEVVLIDGVQEWSWRFLDADLKPYDVWPQATNTGQPAADKPPPAAVELTLRTRDWGQLRFLFKTGADPKANAQNGGGWPAPAGLPGS